MWGPRARLIIFPATLLQTQRLLSSGMCLQIECTGRLMLAPQGVCAEEARALLPLD